MPHAHPLPPATPELVSGTHSIQAAPPDLRNFELASSELLAKRALQQRVDRKYVLPKAMVGPFLQLLEETHHVLGQGETGWARYETCYFDSPDLRSFREHLRGRRPRFKVRIRHHCARQKSFLELKTKDAGGKTRKARAERDFLDGKLSDTDLRFLGKAAPSALSSLSQSVWTNFDRATFLACHEEERVTVDYNLTFVRGQETREGGSFAIVELKQPRLNHRSVAVLALRSLGIREASLSKYCSAVAALHEAAKPREQRSMDLRLRRVS